MNSGRGWAVTMILGLSVGPVAAQAPGATRDAAQRTRIGVTARAVAASDEALRSDDTRLGSTFTARTVAALLPAVQALPRWDQLRSSPALQSNPALAQKWSLSQRAVVAAMQAGVAYLKFSGADTGQLDAPAGAKSLAVGRRRAAGPHPTLVFLGAAFRSGQPQQPDAVLSDRGGP